jgi:hypothetical protein
MPYYETLVLIDSRLGRGELHELLKRIVLRFMDAGGIVTRLRALPSAFTPAGLYEAAARPLPQKLRGPTREKHVAASFVECGAFLFPQALPQVQHQLRLDEQILRITSVRRTAAESLTCSLATERGMAPPRSVRAPPPPPARHRIPRGVVGALAPVSGLEMFIEEFESRHPAGIAVYDTYRKQENPFRGTLPETGPTERED